MKGENIGIEVLDAYRQAELINASVSQNARDIINADQIAPLSVGGYSCLIA